MNNNKLQEDWTKRYTLFHGDLGSYFVNNEEVKQGIHNPIKVNDLSQLLSDTEKRVREEIGKQIYAKQSGYQAKYRKSPRRMEGERHRWHKKVNKRFEGCSRCYEK